VPGNSAASDAPPPKGCVEGSHVIRRDIFQFALADERL
jgi:hypothetical protein